MNPLIAYAKSQLNTGSFNGDTRRLIEMLVDFGEKADEDLAFLRNYLKEKAEGLELLNKQLSEQHSTLTQVNEELAALREKIRSTPTPTAGLS